MKKNLVILGASISLLFAGSAFACDMPGMKDHTAPCPVKENKEAPKKAESIKKEKNIKSKNTHKSHEHKH